MDSLDLPAPAPLPIEIAGERLYLLAGRGLYWPLRKTLIVTDVHLGKAAAMRAHGIAIPGGTTRETLARLTGLLNETGAESLVMLGDLLHAREGRRAATLAEVEAWRARHSCLAILLIRGNHDRRASDPPANWNIECVDPPFPMGPFALVHDPEERASGSYTLAGHLHPAVRLAGPGGQAVRLPCFWFGDACGVLPAFGEFTGTARVRPEPGDRVYAIAGDQIVPIPSQPRSRVGFGVGRRAARSQSCP